MKTLLFALLGLALLVSVLTNPGETHSSAYPGPYPTDPPDCPCGVPVWGFDQVAPGPIVTLEKPGIRRGVR